MKGHIPPCTVSQTGGGNSFERWQKREKSTDQSYTASVRSFACWGSNSPSIIIIIFATGIRTLAVAVSFRTTSTLAILSTKQRESHLPSAAESLTPRELTSRRASAKELSDSLRINNLHSSPGLPSSSTNMTGGHAAPGHGPPGAPVPPSRRIYFGPRQPMRLSDLDAPTSILLPVREARNLPNIAITTIRRFDLAIAPLVQLLDMYITRAATDPRDKVYALWECAPTICTLVA